MKVENNTGPENGNTPKKYWFKPKRYGYGMTPASWEGWLITLGFILILLGFGKYIGMFEAEADQSKDIAIKFISGVLVLSLLFVRASESRCDGELKWRWGLKK